MGSLLHALRIFDRIPGLLGFLAWAILSWGCSQRIAGGSGTETTEGTKVIGRILLADGSPAAGVAIVVRPEGYLRDTAEIGEPRADAFTDLKGAFHLDSMPPGNFVLEARNDVGQAVVGAFEVAAYTAVLELASHSLMEGGSVAGRIGTEGGSGDPGYVQIYGLDRVLKADSSGGFLIRGLAPGRYGLRLLSSRRDWAYPETSDVAIASGDTTRFHSPPPVTFESEDYSLWPGSRTLVIRTAQAALAGELTDFPLLVRLNRDNFDFAASSGKDIRFSDAAGNRLYYAVDSWDSAYREAEVWVKMPKVAADTAGMDLRMHWGRQAAPDFSNPPAVFPSFAGVYHLSESVADNGSGRFFDASPTLAHGTGTTRPLDRTGVIGLGCSFYRDDFIKAPSLPPLKPAATVSVSAWVRVKALGPWGGEVVNMGDNYGLRVEAGGGLLFFVASALKPQAGGPDYPDRWRTLRAEKAGLLDSAWHHVAGTYDGTTLRLYLDGILAASQALSEPIDYGTQGDLSLGRHALYPDTEGPPDNVNFTGNLDEVQITGAARSPDWIRFSYLNQRIGSTLVEHR